MKYKILAITLLLSTLASHADVFSFYSITSNDPSGFSQTVGESQLFMDVIETGSGTVSVTLSNTGPEDSIIKEIYFDTLDPNVDPPVSLELVSIVNGAGVVFVEEASPQNLPAGTDPLIAFCADESAEAQQGQGGAHNGVDPGESVLFQMTYTDPPYSFLDMLTAGELRVGLHVGGMGTGDYSESFINVIPEPASFLLISATATAAVFVRRTFAL